MMFKRYAAVSLFCLVMTTAASAGKDAFLIRPKRGIGPFVAGMSKTKVQKLVKPEEFSEGDEGGKPALSVYFQEPTKRISLRLDKRGKVRGVSLHGDRSVWHDANGITLGSTLQMLEKLNGKPLRLHGFDSSARAGQVLDWQGGALTKKLAKVRITFASPIHALNYTELTETQKVEIESGKDFLSTDPAIQKLNPIIGTIELTL